jgi:hypothetical protein
MTRAQEVMCGARGDRFGVTDTPWREGLPWTTARPTLHGTRKGIKNLSGWLAFHII